MRGAAWGIGVSVRLVRATGEPGGPGESSMNMSSRPVRGRISAVQFVWTRCLYLESRSSSTTPSPFLSVTFPTSPTCTPEIRTLWPCPGVTAWAVENAALILNGDGEMNGKRNRSFVRM